MTDEALTLGQFVGVCRAVCPHCAPGARPEKRQATGEWVHTIRKGASVQHSICWADGLRRSGYAPAGAEGAA